MVLFQGSRKYKESCCCPELNRCAPGYSHCRLFSQWKEICENLMRELRRCLFVTGVKAGLILKQMENVPHISPVFGMWIQNLCNFTSRVFSYLQPWQWKALNCSTNYTAPFVSQAKQEIRLLSAQDGIKKHLVSSVLSNPILTPSHVPMWGCAAPQNRLGNSTNDLPGKSQRAAITCSFADVPLLHRAHVWFLSGRPSFSFPPALTLTSLLSLAHFAVYIAYFLSFLLPFSFSLCPWHSVSVSLLACLSASLFLFLSGLPPFLPHTSSSFSFTFKYVLVGCVSCWNASSDCILHTQGNNKSSVPPPSIFFIFLLSFCTSEMRHCSSKQ